MSIDTERVTSKWLRYDDLISRRQVSCGHPTSALFEVPIRLNRETGGTHGSPFNEPWFPPWRGCARCGLKESAQLRPESERRPADRNPAYVFSTLDELDELVEVVPHEEGMRRLLSARDVVRRFVGLSDPLTGPRKGPKRSPRREAAR